MEENKNNKLLKKANEEKYKWSKKYEDLMAEKKAVEKECRQINRKYNELKAENERIIKRAEKKGQLLLADYAALKSRAQGLVDALDSISHAPVPANEREYILWFVTAKNIAGGAISEWDAANEVQSWNQDKEPPQPESITALKIIQQIKSFTDPQGFIKQLCDEVLGKEVEVITNLTNEELQENINKIKYRIKLHAENENLKQYLWNLVHAVGRLLDDKYSEGDELVRNELWRAMHRSGDQAREYLQNLHTPTTK